MVAPAFNGVRATLAERLLGMHRVPGTASASKKGRDTGEGEERGEGVLERLPLYPFPPPLSLVVGGAHVHVEARNL